MFQSPSDEFISAELKRWEKEERENNKGFYSVTKDGIRLEKGFTAKYPNNFFITCLIDEFIAMGGNLRDLQYKAKD